MIQYLGERFMATALNTSCSEVKQNSRRLPLKTKTTKKNKMVNLFEEFDKSARQVQNNCIQLRVWALQTKSDTCAKSEVWILIKRHIMSHLFRFTLSVVLCWVLTVILYLQQKTGPNSMTEKSISYTQCWKGEMCNSLLEGFMPMAAVFYGC